LLAIASGVPLTIASKLAPTTSVHGPCVGPQDQEAPLEGESIHTSLRIATNTPSPLRGEGWREGESGVNLNHHPLPNPGPSFRSPLKGEGLYLDLC
jgi:hypothetical protein